MAPLGALPLILPLASYQGDRLELIATCPRVGPQAWAHVEAVPQPYVRGGQTQSTHPVHNLWTRHCAMRRGPAGPDDLMIFGDGCQQATALPATSATRRAAVATVRYHIGEPRSAGYTPPP